jgi:DNA-binding transcriptional MerR regulator
MQIGELSNRTGVTTKTIRYYEDIGVLPVPFRSANGYRDYEDSAVERLRFIRDAKATGLTLGEISSVLELREQNAPTCEHVAGLLEHHLEALDEHIRTLRHARRQLAALADRARSVDPADCTDPHRCQTIAPNDTVAAGAPTDLHQGPQAHRH